MSLSELTVFAESESTAFISAAVTQGGGHPHLPAKLVRKLHRVCCASTTLVIIHSVNCLTHFLELTKIHRRSIKYLIIPMGAAETNERGGIPFFGEGGGTLS